MSNSRKTSHTDKHRFSNYVPDAVYGANDGIITTFAIISGVAGAQLDNTVVIILGMSNVLADGFSMGASNYLARRTSPNEAERDAALSVQHGLVTFTGFVVIGIIPLVAYLIPIDDAVRYETATALTLATLFLVGAARTLVTRTSWIRGGIEMLLIGAAAAALAYWVGSFTAGLL